MKLLTMSAVTAGLILSAATSQAGLDLDLGNLPSTGISFVNTGGVTHKSTFTLTSTTPNGPQFDVLNDVGGNGSALGLKGKITGGPWELNNYQSQVSTIGSGPSLVTITTETASVVASPTTFTLADGSGPGAKTLSATLNWAGILSSTTVVGSRGSSSGILNYSAQVNLTHVTYTGSNHDLQLLASLGSGTMTLSYNFTTQDKLSKLMATLTPIKTGYTANISAVPEPTTVISGFAALGFMFVSGWNLHRRKQDVVRMN